MFVVTDSTANQVATTAWPTSENFHVITGLPFTNVVPLFVVLVVGIAGYYIHTCFGYHFGESLFDELDHEA